MKLRIYILFSLLLHFSAVWWLRPSPVAVQDLTEVQVIETFQSTSPRVKSSPRQSSSPKISSSSVVSPAKSEKEKSNSKTQSSAESADSSPSPHTHAGTEIGQNNFEAVNEGVVTEAPKVLQEKKIPYPISARRAGVEGVVELKLVIDAQGQVREAELIRGPGYGLDEAALNAIKEFRFSPAKIGNEKVAVRILYKYRFRLGGSG